MSLGSVFYGSVFWQERRVESGSKPREEYIQGRNRQILVLLGPSSSHNAANHKIRIPPPPRPPPTLPPSSSTAATRRPSRPPRRPRRCSLHVASSVVRCTSSTVTSHTGQPEKHAVNRHLRPPPPPCQTWGDLVWATRRATARRDTTTTTMATGDDDVDDDDDVDAATGDEVDDDDDDDNYGNG